MHARHSEVSASHLFEQPVNLAACVHVDDGLRDRKSAVQVAKSLKLPVLTLDGNVKLLDTLINMLGNKKY